jgi:hypothetical protein
LECVAGFAANFRKRPAIHLLRCFPVHWPDFRSVRSLGEERRRFCKDLQSFFLGICRFSR